MLEQTTRPLSQKEKSLMNLRQFDATRIIFVDDQVRVSSWKLKLDALPEYDLLTTQPVRELCPAETLMRILYYVEDQSRPLPLGTKITPEKTVGLSRIQGAANPRTGLLTASFANRNGIGRFYATQENQNVHVVRGPPSTPVGSLVMCPRILKGCVLKRHGYVDIDQEKSHPTLMCVLGSLMGTSTAGLLRYVQRREEVLAEAVDFWSIPGEVPLSTKDVKNLVNRTVYGGTVKGWIDDIRSGESAVAHNGAPAFSTPPKNLRNDDGVSVPPMFRELRDECVELMQLAFLSNPELAARLARPGDTIENDGIAIKRRVISYLCQTIEHHITYTALAFCAEIGAIPRNEDGSRTFIWGYDGFSWVPPRGMNVAALVEEINIRVHEQCGPPFDLVRFALKDVDEFIPEVLDDDHPLWSSSDFANYENVSRVHKRSRFEVVSEVFDYPEAKRRFEREFFKIDDPGFPHMYGKEVRDDNGKLSRVDWLDRAGLFSRCSQYNFLGVDKKGAEKKMNFPEKWVKDERLRLYDTANIYPPPLVCPRSTFNLWTDSPYHDAPITRHNPGPWSRWERLLCVVCGAVSIDDPRCQYVLFFVCQMIQHPGIKLGVILVLLGSEGCGKSLFTMFLAALVGAGRYIDTKMSNIIGDFNSLLDGKLLVVIQEIDKMTREETSKFKTLLTDRDVTINAKGVQQYSSRSYHRFIATSNDINAIDSDRRPFYVSCLVDLKLPENLPFLEQLWRDIDDPHALCLVYHELQNINMDEKFGSSRMKPPETAINRTFRESRRWTVAFAGYILGVVYGNKTGTVVVSGVELHQYFAAWKGLGSDYATLEKTQLTVTNEFVLGMSWGTAIGDNVLQPFPFGRFGRLYNLDKMRELLPYV